MFRQTALVTLMLTAALLTGCNRTDLSSPKAAAKTFFKAMENNDVATAKKACTGADDKSIESLAATMANFKKFSDAAKSKFGDKAKNLDDLKAFDVDSIDQATVKENGNEAMLDSKGSNAKLKKVDGDWKVDVSDMAAMLPMMKGLGDAAGKAADGINNGSIKTMEDAKKQVMGSGMGISMPH